MKDTNLKLKSQTFLISLVLIIYWFYVNICFGYFLSKIFYSIHGNFSKNIQFRKKLTIEFFLKSIKKVVIRLKSKIILCHAAVYRLIIVVKIFLEKFKSLRKLKYNFQPLKNLLPIFFYASQIFRSLLNDLLVFKNMRNFIIQ